MFNGRHNLRLSVIAEQPTVLAPGHATFVIRVANNTAHADSGLRIGIEPIVNGSPVGWSEQPRFVGRCKIAAGTTVCRFQTVPAHASVTETIVVAVPVRFGPGDVTNVGSTVSVGAYLESKQSQLVTPIGSARSHIAATPHTLPFTGFPGSAAFAAGCALTLVGILICLATRRWRLIKPQ
jgi:hypothetical protein